LSKDINPILAGWDHDPDEIQVRLVAGDDGREKLQMRLDLGLLQMELSGRPDGQRPMGSESVLDALEAKARSQEGQGIDFHLRPEDCVLLMREGIQYYHRYLALFHLGRYDLVARDTERNLRLFAFVVRHADSPSDKMQFDQYRPYVTMMRARALGLSALERDDHRTALARIDEGIDGIRAFLREYDYSEKDHKCRELKFLKDWRREVEKSRRVSPVERLEEQLSLAIAREQYEEAARLRDQIKRAQGSEDDGPQSSGFSRLDS
jgi:hypothetical protein